jgi:putative FmdB family regulatory protein
MPVYEFSCQDCGTIERFYKIADKPEEIICTCGKTAKSILSLPAVFCDADCSWVGAAARHHRKEQRYPKKYKPIETRGEYKQWRAENPHLEPIDGPNLTEI